MSRICLAVAFALATALPAAATPDAKLQILLDALALEDTIEIMHLEGLAYGEDLEEELLQGGGGASWDAVVTRIYDTERMTEQLTGALAEQLSEAELDPLIAFFQSETGARIVSLEVSARRALLEDAVDEASRDNLAEMIEDGDARLDLIRAYSDANGLVEENVVGAMNSNYAFYLGLQEGGAMPVEMSEAEILADVWSQEDDIRSETQEWVLSYLAMAYQPLSDDEIQTYIDMSRTEAGQALNRALFDGFDVMFVDISRALGLAASRYLIGEEI